MRYSILALALAGLAAPSVAFAQSGTTTSSDCSGLSGAALAECNANLGNQGNQPSENTAGGGVDAETDTLGTDTAPGSAGTLPDTEPGGGTGTTGTTGGTDTLSPTTPTDSLGTGGGAGGGGANGGGSSGGGSSGGGSSGGGGG